jgi:curved DNA-binding protein CbpA
MSRDGDDRDPYSLLGVSRQASSSDISRAYRRAARETHPDNRRGDPLAAERFNAVTDAYETLRDPGRRAAYDRAHPIVRSVTRRAVYGAPPPVRLGPPRRSTVAFGVPVEPIPLGRRPPLWAGPVEVTSRAGARSTPSAGFDDLFELAAALSRSLRAAWFLS